MQIQKRFSYDHYFCAQGANRALSSLIGAASLISQKMRLCCKLNFCEIREAAPMNELNARLAPCAQK